MVTIITLSALSTSERCVGELFSDNNKCLLSSPSIANCLSDCEESISIQYVMLVSNCGRREVLCDGYNDVTHTHTN